METLTIRQAFDAMVCFLEDYYQRSKSDEIAAILSGLSLLWLDPSTGEKWTGDPAYWIDWMKCVQNILFPDTPENHRMLEKLVSDQTNKLGTDSWGSIQPVHCRPRTSAPCSKSVSGVHRHPWIYGIIRRFCCQEKSSHVRLERL
jgi:hypothetical protein